MKKPVSVEPRKQNRKGKTREVPVNGEGTKESGVKEQSRKKTGDDFQAKISEEEQASYLKKGKKTEFPKDLKPMLASVALPNRARLSRISPG